ncbi:NACHT domain-containing protein [Asanoa sp. NPDC049573]|uniref:NACHT domain-containing protein n=1 Tax=Asanoa sp. NPDC049573 TaxID=3155396 RepID=UPI00342A6230
MFDVAIAGLAKGIATRAVGDWLKQRTARARQGQSLTSLIEITFIDRYARKDFQRQFEAICDQVEQRLLLTWDGKFQYLDATERRACVLAVTDIVARQRVTDRTLMAADMDAVKLAAQLRENGKPLEGYGLSAEGDAFAARLLVDSCEYLIQLAQVLPEYAARVDAQILARLSTLSEQVRQMLERMPRSVRDDTPDDDAEFLQKYLAFISKDLDSLDLIGVDVPDAINRATLSVAYLSLTVSSAATRSVIGGSESSGRAADASLVASRRIRVEDALAKSRRSLIMGEAGSGKTTLLRWLAVTAARSTFTDKLRGWNDQIPLLVPLRHFDNTGLPAPSDLLRLCSPAIAAGEPSGWTMRQLASGRVLLLVDGMDELGPTQRRNAASWLRQLSHLHDLNIVVTSRPAAVAADRLSDAGFESVMLEPMNREDVRVFVRQWHQAVWHAGRERASAPDRATMDVAERSVLGQLDARPHLRRLATTPLLCALVCALNISRHSRLPRDRMEIYKAAMEMLDRREVERGLTSASAALLSPRQRQYLLQGLAWRLAERAKSEMPKGRAVEWLANRLRHLPMASQAPSAEEVLDDFIARSGIIREPVAGRIDFIHKSFLEFLAAKEATDELHVDILIDKAHLDWWRELVVMAAGHASTKVQAELLDGVLGRARSEPRRSRQLALVAIACMETSTYLSAEIREDLDRAIDAVLPPRNIAEARSLASAGGHVLKRLPTDPAELSASSAAAVVRTAVYVGGSDAIAFLRHFGHDERPAVVAQLVAGWDYFDADSYAAEVLAPSPLINGSIEIADVRQLHAARHLRHLERLAAVAEPAEIAELADVPELSALVIRRRPEVAATSLSQVAKLTSLRTLVVEPAIAADELARLGALTSLQQLHAVFTVSPSSLDFLAEFSDLRSVGLRVLDQVGDLSVLTALPHLREIALWHLSVDATLPAAELARTLEDLTLVEYYGDEVATMISSLSALRRLRVFQSDGLTSLRPLTSLPLLELWLRDCGGLSDLDQLSEIKTLETLVLIDCPTGDLGFLARLPRLRDLYLRVDDPFDLADLGERARRLRVHLIGGQQLAGRFDDRRAGPVEVRRAWNVLPSWDRMRGWQARTA